MAFKVDLKREKKGGKESKEEQKKRNKRRGIKEEEQKKRNKREVLKYTPQNGRDKKKGSLKVDTRRIKSKGIKVNWGQSFFNEYMCRRIKNAKNSRTIEGNFTGADQLKETGTIGNAHAVGKADGNTATGKN